MDSQVTPAPPRTVLCGCAVGVCIIQMCVSVYILCTPVCTFVMERGVWWMNCPALWKHARFPPPRHLKRMALSPLFWTPSLLSKTNGRALPPPLPPPAWPPLCGRQVAALLAFATGRHTQSWWVRKDFSPPCGHPAWAPFYYALSEALPPSSITLTTPMQKKKKKLKKNQ